MVQNIQIIDLNADIDIMLLIPNIVLTHLLFICDSGMK